LRESFPSALLCPHVTAGPHHRPCPLGVPTGAMAQRGPVRRMVPPRRGR
jgi:hypothetical protein